MRSVGHSRRTRKRAQRARFRPVPKLAQTANPDCRRFEIRNALIRTSATPIAVPAPMLASFQPKLLPLEDTSSGV